MKWGDAPIDGRYDTGTTRDHRGRKWPIVGCPCLPCLHAWVCLGVSGKALAGGPGG